MFEQWVTIVGTPELRKKSEELGYKCSSLRCDRPCLYAASYLNAYHSIHPEWRDNKDIYKTNDIDCGTNEDLFLAIAALRDDIDIHQWFTDGKEWFQCRFLKVGMHYSDKPEILFERWHKATVGELIEHFREKEE